MKISHLRTTDLANEGQAFEIKLPSGKPTGVKITVLGQDSRVFRERVAEFRRQVAGKDMADVVGMSEQEAMTTRLACTVMWEGLEDEDGKPLPCTPDNAREFYESAPWVAEQVDAFMGNRSNFLPAVLKA
jgi:hypothetical protein